MRVDEFRQLGIIKAEHVKRMRQGARLRIEEVRFSMSYLMLIVLTLIIGLIANGRVNGQLKKYSKIPTATGLTGAQAAEQMLRFHNVSGVAIRRGNSGQDFFDPRNNSITLEPSAYDGSTITAVATACHEVGHACQYANDYTPMKVRTAIVPVVNAASNAWVFILMIGIMLQLASLTNLAIVMYALVVLFALVTLPVEFNASHRALDYMGALAVPAEEQKGASSVLRACAFTYVASALISILQLLWLLGMRDN